jgi:hypothetical protein
MTVRELASPQRTGGGEFSGRDEWTDDAVAWGCGDPFAASRIVGA